LNDPAAIRAFTVMSRAVREATLTALAMAAAAACAWWLDPAPGAIVLGAVLALSLARSHLAAERRGWLEALALLPVVGLACMGVGHLLHEWRWLGAVVFVAVVASSTWVRRFGPLAQRLGRLVLLPFVTLLVVPPLPRSTWPLPHAFVLVAPLLIALASLACVLLAQWLGRRLGWLAAASPAEPQDAPAAATSALRPSPTTRLALQMAFALAAAFVVGDLVFPTHWRWVVLTALLVNVGNRGRLDVVNKSVLRVLGAGAGTVLALAVGGHAQADGALVAVLAIACVFIGLVLRPLGYGWWALCVTLALALLQSVQPGSEPLLLGQRLLEIVVGATIGLAAAWFVLPIRSIDVLRRRIAGALAAMSAALDPQVADRRSRDVVAALAQVAQLRPSFRAHAFAPRRWKLPQAGDWIAALAACEAPIVALVERGETPGAVRKAIGVARKAMREPAQIGPALAALRDVLERGPGAA
jgi:hypothetical protein